VSISTNGNHPESPEISEEAIKTLQSEWSDPNRYNVGSAADNLLGPRVALLMDITSLVRFENTGSVTLQLSVWSAKQLGLDLICEAERAHNDFILLRYMYELDDEAKAVRPSPKGLMLQILDEFKSFRQRFEDAMRRAPRETSDAQKED
jgi:hypothetical protein